MTLTARTMDYYRKQGFAVAIAERWIPRINIRKDLFGFADLVAIRPGEPVVAIQSTSRSCISARVAKARKIPALAVWLSTGAKFVVIGWGQVEGRWHPRIVELRADALEVEAVVIRKPPRKRRKSRYHPADLFADVGEPVPPLPEADASVNEPPF